MESYCNWQTPLWRDETRTTKYFDLPLNSRFRVISPMAVNGLWQVEYNDKIGWIQDKYLEEYIENLPTNCVDLSGIQTAETNDAQQYIIWDGQKQVNMCGEICAAYIMQIPLDELLIRWKQNSPPLYKRIFGAGKARGTGAEELVELFGIFGYISTTLKLQKYTPRLFADMVARQKGIIVSCHLNTQTGALNGSGVLHWCVVKEVIVDRVDMGWVTVFNPFGNAEERYSWREFLATTRSPYGVVV